ncbi:MAG: hypothetical protein GY854_03850 [Deltaproteobacteria bacterium]|nr:hypothetical protein [Deltaproteobacteria bacterium]
MKITIVSAATVALFLMACGRDGEPAPSAALAAVSTDKVKKEKKRKRKNAPIGEVPSLPASMEWIGLSDSPYTMEDLALKITNRMESDAIVNVRLNFHGLISKRAEIDLGEHQLSPQMETLVSLPAADIPIQSETGVCQAVAEVTVRAQGDPNTPGANLMSVPVFYRHGQKYSNPELFSFQYVTQELGGRIAGDPNVQGDVILGRVADEQGSFVDVSTRDAAVTTYKGQVVGREVGKSVSFGRANKNGKHKEISL